MAGGLNVKHEEIILTFDIYFISLEFKLLKCTIQPKNLNWHFFISSMNILNIKFNLLNSTDSQNIS